MLLWSFHWKMLLAEQARSYLLCQRRHENDGTSWCVFKEEESGSI